MKNAIYEYLELSDTEKTSLWENAIFIFDTNVYLDLYRYSQKTRSALLDAMAQLKDRIWMPNHVAHEFMKDRIEVIFETINRHSKLQPEIEKFVKICANTLRIKEKDTEVCELKKYVENWVVSNENKNLLVKDVSNDPVLTNLLNLYDGKVGKAFTEEELADLKQDGLQRYNKKTPPGYKDAKKIQDDDDNNAFGDLIIWKEILEYAKNQKRDIVFITEDGKEDWWNIYNGKTIGPRIELRKEFVETTKQKFHMYSMDGFLRYLNGNDKNIDSSIIDEVKTLEKRNNRRNSYYFDPQFNELCHRFGEEIAQKIVRINRQIDRIKRKNIQREKSIESLMKKYKSDNIPPDAQETINNNQNKIIQEEAKISKLTEQLLVLQLQ